MVQESGSVMATNMPDHVKAIKKLGNASDFVFAGEVRGTRARLTQDPIDSRVADEGRRAGRPKQTDLGRWVRARADRCAPRRVAHRRRGPFTCAGAKRGRTAAAATVCRPRGAFSL
jgi:hypothetical protein